MKGQLKIIADYADALTTLDRYDHGQLGIDGSTATTDFVDELRTIWAKSHQLVRKFEQKQENLDDLKKIYPSKTFYWGVDIK